ncbi:MAG: hypothetical protein A2289_09735 [Deltaproteobacteria bacterium RIFOXYA12_FULL_58_15]|nr:MAG: hypothetical protein A2289_09735 [Deltaproteobacteria bacterium RIFOXYA12_FULL_58_15]
MISVKDFFAPDGPLARSFADYEPRAEQVELALAIESAILSRDKLLAEAGTGIGKSLAYLVPVIESGKQAVVSTGTKNLQDQLLTQDVPIVERAVGREIHVEVAKGRTNYLCHLRAERFLAQPLLPSTDDTRIVNEVMLWRETTHTGDRAELRSLGDHNPLWRELTANSDQCVGRKCPQQERCWVTLMRQRAQAAELVIANHHLYLADLSLRGRFAEFGVFLLPAHDLVIFDEAHDLPEAAAHHFGHQISERRLSDLAHDVTAMASTDPGLAAVLGPTLIRLRQSVAELFDKLPFANGRTPLFGKRPIDVLDWYLSVDEQLEQIEATLGSTDQDEASGIAKRTAVTAAELAFVLRVEPRRSLVTDVDLPMTTDDNTWVRYTELSGRNRSVVARPIDVAPILRQSLQLTTAITVSATLTVGGSFEHFRSSIGFKGAHELAVGSPFDFASNARLYIPTDLPEPSAPDFAEKAALRTAHLITASGGGAFVLCTSHRALPVMRALIESETGMGVIMQGDGPRSLLVDEFRNHGDAILVATMSFWQGVDVPGDALRLVVIDKLPFASPGDPVVAAKIQYLRQRGEEPFYSYQVPQAALLLRQGFGRLIRRHSDKGLVAVLDCRLHTKGYGRIFLDSLPNCPQLSELSEAEEFLASMR